MYPWNHPSVVLLLSLCLPVVVGCEPNTDGVATGLPSQGNTADYEQAETVVTIVPRGIQPDRMIVSYNDRTQDPGDPKIIYPSGLSGDDRTIFRGASLMGWSTSVDDGATFTYQGKVQPPVGWSLVWGDPALTTSGDLTVYLANLAGSDVKFPPSGEIVNMGVRDFLDGFCVARSGNGGVAFSAVECFKKGVCEGANLACSNDADCFSGQCNGVLYDGSALAATGTDVFFASTDVHNSTVDVWQASTAGLNFQRIADLPFDNNEMTLHPRLRIFGNRLYVLAHRSDGVVLASFLEIGTSTFSDPLAVSLTADVNFTAFLSDRALRTANQFSFDVGNGSATSGAELRVAITRILGEKRHIEVYRCSRDLLPLPGFPGVAQCEFAIPWSSIEERGDNWSPLLKVAGVPPVWKLVYLSREENPEGNTVSVQQGNLVILPDGTRSFVGSKVVDPQVPCNSQNVGFAADPGGYWGDYNDLTNLLSSPANSQRFVTPFTDNRTGCDFRGKWTAEMHVSVAVF